MIGKKWKCNKYHYLLYIYVQIIPEGTYILLPNKLAGDPTPDDRILTREFHEQAGGNATEFQRLHRERFGYEVTIFTAKDIEEIPGGGEFLRIDSAQWKEIKREPKWERMEAGMGEGRKK